MSDDSRTGRRFRVRLPIRIAAPEGKSQGVTRDVSAAGVFIQAEPDLRVGASVRFDITLPSELLGVERDVQVACLGRVVRVEPAKRGGRAGVACVIDSYKFQPPKASVVRGGKKRC